MGSNNFERNIVKSFFTTMASGDGVTDDTSVLQADINKASGCVLVIPCGNYKISSTLNIPANTIIYGYGARIFNTSTVINMLNVNSGVEVYGLEIEGTGDYATNADGIAIKADSADYTDYFTNIVIKDCYIHDMDFYGVYSYYVRGMEIIDTRIEDIGYCGILGLSVESINVSHCTIKNIVTGNASNAYGVAFSRKSNTSDTTTYPYSKDCTVTNCTISNIPLWVGISSKAVDTLNYSNNLIRGCKMGIRCGACAGDGGASIGATNRAIVANNIMYGTGEGSGIRMNGSEGTFGTGCVISGNTLYEFGTDDSETDGAIYVEYTEGTIISNNTLRNCFENGIIFASRNDGFSCTGNNIFDVQSTTYAYPTGILLYGDYNKGTITGNTLSRDVSALNNYVSIRGISILGTSPNVKIGQNYNEFSTRVYGVTANMLLQNDMTAKAKAYLSVGQSNIVDSTLTKVALDSEVYDVGSNFDTVNNRFVAPVDGYYLIMGQIYWKALTDNKLYGAVITISGAEKLTGRVLGHSGTTRLSAFVPASVQYLTAGQYVELYAYQVSGVDTPDIEGGSENETFLAVHLLSI